MQNQIMTKTQIKFALSDDTITQKIYLIRNHKVMLDRDLAELYGVSTGNLNKAVKRNMKRFPKDFMFKLAKTELKDWIFQFGTSNREKKGLRKLPLAFTEQGVAMLSGVLNSPRAIDVNIRIIRIFTKMREMILTHKDILLKLEQIEKRLVNEGEKTKKHDAEIQLIFTYLKELLNPTRPPMKKIGYKQYSEE